MTNAIRIAFASFILLISIGTAVADCFYNGRSYPEGTAVGDRVCSNGSWVQRR
jgi:hypothetical protein